MRGIKRFFPVFFYFFHLPFLFAGSLETPFEKYSVGERFVYEISYLNVGIGEAEAEIREIIPYRNRQAYHIVVRARSYRILDWIYKVRDEYHSYIDTETLESLRYEKKLRQGRRRIEETLDFDPARGRVKIAGGKHAGKEAFLEKKSQDEISCGYFFRTLPVGANTSVFIPVFADGKNWKLQVDVRDLSEMTIKKIGKLRAVEIEPHMEFQGFLVRKGRIRGWVSADARRLPLKMKVKIPVMGDVVCELSEYVPGK